MKLDERKKELEDNILKLQKAIQEKQSEINNLSTELVRQQGRIQEITFIIESSKKEEGSK